MTCTCRNGEIAQAGFNNICQIRIIRAGLDYPSNLFLAIRHVRHRFRLSSIASLPLAKFLVVPTEEWFVAMRTRSKFLFLFWPSLISPHSELISSPHRIAAESPLPLVAIALAAGFIAEAPRLLFESGTPAPSGWQYWGYTSSTCLDSA